MEINVTATKVDITEISTINQGEYAVNQCNFTFSEEYEGLIKRAVFSTILNKRYLVEIVDNKCNIPSEVLDLPGTVYLGVYAYEKDNNGTLTLRYSPANTSFTVTKGSYTSNANVSSAGAMDLIDRVNTLIDKVQKELADGELNGVGIQDITFNSDYVMSITLTNGDIYTSPVLQGEKGDTGDQGETGNGIDSVILNPNYTLTINFTDGTSTTTNPIRGEKGDTGKGIANLEKISTVGKVDTYRITYTDGDTFEYNVTNGEISQADLDTAVNLLETQIGTKQNKLTAGANIDITNNEISATDTNTTYEISKSGNTITLTGSDGSTTTVDVSDTTYTAGANIQISPDNKISATDTKYTAGENITIENGVISARDTVYHEATHELTGLMKYPDKRKLDNIEENAQENVIEDVKVDGISLAVTDKSVNIELPKNLSNFNNDKGFITKNVNNLTYYTLASNTGSTLELVLDNTTFVLKAFLKDIDGNIISTSSADLKIPLATKQDVLTAGANIKIEDNVISVTNTGGYTAGDNITIENDVISATDTTYEPVTVTQNGLMTALDKRKLNNIEAEANKYVLPVATDEVLGGVKVGDNLSIDENGVLSADAQSIAIDRVLSTSSENPVQNKAVTNAINTKANKSTTLAGYGIENAYTKSEVDAKTTAVYRYKGSVTTYANLPTAGLTIGDVYIVEEADPTHGIVAGANVVWNGSSWDKLGGEVDFSNYYDKQSVDDLVATKADKLTTYTKAEVDTELAKKVDKVTGKQLSTEDYTTAEKEKLGGIEEGSEVNDIISISVNGVARTIDLNRNVDIDMPTKLSDLTNDNDTVTDANYVHTDNNYTTKEKTKLANIEDTAEVNIIETVKVNGTALIPDNDRAVDVLIPAADEYSIVVSSTTEGYAKTYSLTKNNTEIGVKIDIPKDLVVSDGEVKTVETADVPYTGAVVGDKYIDLTIANATNQHIYIPVKDLVDVYTGGNGINIDNSNVVNVVVNSANANGLSVTANGIELATATTTDAGAMSANDKTKLDGIEASADVNMIEIVKVNDTALTPDVNKAVNIEVPTKTSDLTNDSGFIDKTVNDLDNYYTETQTDTLLADKVDKVTGKGLSTEDYTTAEQTKLAGIETGAEVNDIDTIKVNGTTQTISNKEVNITVPTKISDLEDDSDFISTSVTEGLVKNDGTIDTTQYISDVSDKQNKTLETPLTIGGASRTTVEGALEGLNGVVPSDASASNKLMTRRCIRCNNASDLKNAIVNLPDYSQLDFVAVSAITIGGVTLPQYTAWHIHKDSKGPACIGGVGYSYLDGSCYKIQGSNYPESVGLALTIQKLVTESDLTSSVTSGSTAPITAGGIYSTFQGQYATMNTSIPNYQSGFCKYVSIGAFIVGSGRIHVSEDTESSVEIASGLPSNSVIIPVLIYNSTHDVDSGYARYEAGSIIVNSLKEGHSRFSFCGFLINE